MEDMVESLRRRILAARKEIPVDLVLKNGNVINLFTGEIDRKEIAVLDGIIIGVGADYHGKEEIVLKDKWVVPGFIDGHIHIESSMLPPSLLAPELLCHGTTAIVSDPHEIANVMGLEGIRFMLEDSRSIPFDIFFTAPSCVPATPLETSGATLRANDLKELIDEPQIIGLAEMMNFPGVLMGDQDVLEKLILFREKTVDGHCPTLMGHNLQACIAAGIGSDHETISMEEGLEKVRKGMMLMIREGTSAKNLKDLLPLVTYRNAGRFCFVSDDLHPEDIEKRGHLDYVIKTAVGMGLDPVMAIQLVTLSPARYFGLKGRGAIAPGYRSDLVILDDLVTFKISSVYKDGLLVVDHGKLLNFPVKKSSARLMEHKPLNIAKLKLDNFRIPHMGTKARVIEIIPGQLLTHTLYEEVKSEGGFVVSDIQSDILKICVVERHHASGNVGLGLVKGFGLKQGAIASSVAHDSHNIIAVGVNDKEIMRAVEEVSCMGGGLAVVLNDKVISGVPLEIAGIMSAQPLKTLVKQLNRVKEAARQSGCDLEEPFMNLSFLALPVIPELKLTDMGLVDVNRFEIVPIFADI